MKIKYSYGNVPRKVIAILLAILYVSISILLPIISGLGYGISAGNMSISGILTAVQLGLAFVIVSIEFDLGGTLSIILVGISIIQTLLSIFVRQDYSAATGLSYYIVCLFALHCIRHSLLVERRNSLVDELTGLSNRKHIIQYMDHRILVRKPFYSIYIDIDNFKIINSSKGHEFCDTMLKELSKRWENVDPRNASIGRVGGDEFLIVVKKTKNEDIDAYVQKYIEVVKEWAEEKEIIDVLVSASFGVSSYPEDGNNSSDIMRKSALAMRHAKETGRNICYKYEQAFEEIVFREQYIESRIRDALDNDKFFMVYQPQFNTMTKKLRGFESLIRMKSFNDEKLISPGDFIPVAEKSNLIVEIGEFVLRRTMLDFAPFFAANPDYLLSVNVSAKQLLSRDFVAYVEKVLNDTSFNPKNLEIEITEYCLLEATEEVTLVINRLKEMGIKLAMDDFGTGYSSLSYLTKLPIDLIKIDKTLIDTMTNGEIIKAIVSMGHALGCEIIAEGVEEENQLDILRRNECDFIQGFIWGKPMVLDEAIELL